MSYRVIAIKNFTKQYKKLIEQDQVLVKALKKVSDMLKESPFQASLKTHRATTRNYGPAWSSSVTGDLRVIWKFDEQDRILILLLDLGGHSGKNKVYK